MSSTVADVWQPPAPLAVRRGRDAALREAIAQRFGQPFDVVLRDLFARCQKTKSPQRSIAEQLEVSEAAVSRWLREAGLIPGTPRDAILFRMVERRYGQPAREALRAVVVRHQGNLEAAADEIGVPVSLLLRWLRMLRLTFRVRCLVEFDDAES